MKGKKKCKGKCQKALPATAEYFDRHPQTADKLNGTCKVCKVEAAREKRQNNKDTAISNATVPDASWTGACDLYV